VSTIGIVYAVLAGLLVYRQFNWKRIYPMLLGPLLFPIARQVGIPEVHYAMVVTLAMGIGLFAPPFGVGYYAARAISRIHPNEGMRPIVGYMVALFIGTVLVAAIP
jgi:TRAP-type C4-dicarboxylate transport system permease large subunit